MVGEEKPPTAPAARAFEKKCAAEFPCGGLEGLAGRLREFFGSGMRGLDPASQQHRLFGDKPRIPPRQFSTQSVIEVADDQFFESEPLQGMEERHRIPAARDADEIGLAARISGEGLGDRVFQRGVMGRNQQSEQYEQSGGKDSTDISERPGAASEQGVFARVPGRVPGVVIMPIRTASLLVFMLSEMPD
jgi:hypothetical protein